MSSQIKGIAREVTVAVGIAYAIALHQAGLSFDTTTQKLLGFAPAVVVGLIFAFDLLLWKTPGISKYFGRPRIYGTWLATITPRQGSAIPDGGNWGPIKSAVVIEQTFWTTAVHLITDESQSHSTAIEFVKRNGSRDRQRLVYTYANTPKQAHQPRSTPHTGATEFEVVGPNPNTMTGTYWTARLTVGDMSLRRLDNKTDRATLEVIKSAAQAKGIDWP
jgi:hypothetical protein